MTEEILEQRGEEGSGDVCVGREPVLGWGTGTQGPSGLWSKHGWGASVFGISEGHVKKKLVA